ncbi:histidine kinase [Streptomyces hoynatensis]|uniref:histidine kinase n=1 Tax=Streptomyces hoynatensis TaxID=1141874 RepID=UPI001319F3AA|nr:histidine kinase [Streptomyces hoynatensis]
MRAQSKAESAPERTAPFAPPWWEAPRGRRAVRYGLVLLVLAVSVQAQPRPGVHGTSLVALAGLAGVFGGGAALVWLRGRGRQPMAAQVALFAVVLAASVALVWVEPDGRGFLGGYLLTSVAASRESTRLGAAVTAATLAVLGVAGLAAPDRSAVAVVVSELGMVAFYRVGRYGRWLRERTEQAERLTAEVERTRAAQLRAATLGERQRLAREMHDVLAHSLSGLLIHLEAARLLAARESADPRLTDAIRRAHHLAEAGLGEARQAIGMLRDADLPGPERLQALAEEFTRDTGLPCELARSGRPVPLGPESGLTLYRVAQEALTNVRTHAAPDRVELRLAYEPDGVTLTVEDMALTAGYAATEGALRTAGDTALTAGDAALTAGDAATEGAPRTAGYLARAAGDTAPPVGDAAPPAEDTAPPVADAPPAGDTTPAAGHVGAARRREAAGADERRAGRGAAEVAGGGGEFGPGPGGVPTPRAGSAGDHGYGLTGMRERAALLDGTLTAQATPRGFLVRLWIPEGASGT